MDQEQYADIQTMLFSIGAIVGDADLTGFIAAIDRANTVGAIIDPTLRMRGQERMMKIREMAVALRSFQEAHRALENLVSYG